MGETSRYERLASCADCSMHTFFVLWSAHVVRKCKGTGAVGDTAADENVHAAPVRLDLADQTDSCKIAKRVACRVCQCLHVAIEHAVRGPGLAPGC